MELDNDESSNIEDRRGEGGGFGGGFGGGGFGGGGLGGPGIPIPLGGGLFKGGFGLIAIVVIGLILGVNPLALLGLAGGGEASYVAPPSQTSQFSTRICSQLTEARAGTAPGTATGTGVGGTSADGSSMGGNDSSGAATGSTAATGTESSTGGSSPGGAASCSVRSETRRSSVRTVCARPASCTRIACMSRRHLAAMIWSRGCDDVMM